jgi:hypothetical protein
LLPGALPLPLFFPFPACEGSDEGSDENFE